ncbi:pectinesterase-like [Olea europaea subsp. europaea]|uniref:Pectinesterase-like n=1 Tax=Olea europaea subsp. europaea TaxID=158383 RepID=A0A8S0R4K2_OLEEU|nr:pectinesterase-like [Olea europaea subsp. europaea]
MVLDIALGSNLAALEKGRPWKEYSRAIITESTLADFIQTAGWMPWDGNLYLDTLDFTEYQNQGQSAATEKRVKWKGFHVITDRNQALSSLLVDLFKKANG